MSLPIGPHVPYLSQSVHTWGFVVACELILPPGLNQLLSSVHLYQINLLETPLSFARCCANTSCCQQPEVYKFQPVFKEFPIQANVNLYHQSRWHTYMNAHEREPVLASLSEDLLILFSSCPELSLFLKVHIRFYFLLEHFYKYSSCRNPALPSVYW